MIKQFVKQCRAILDIDTGEQCQNKTKDSYDFQYGKGTMPNYNIRICDKCLKKVDIPAHLYWKKRINTKQNLSAIQPMKNKEGVQYELT